MSTTKHTTGADDAPQTVDGLVEKHGDRLERLAATDLPIASYAQAALDIAHGEDTDAE